MTNPKSKAELIINVQIALAAVLMLLFALSVVATVLYLAFSPTSHWTGNHQPILLAANMLLAVLFGLVVAFIAIEYAALHVLAYCFRNTPTRLGCFDVKEFQERISNRWK